MLRVVMFDLGDTLIDSSRRPLPNVRAALGTIHDLCTASGDPLRTCLVSDFDPAPTPQDIPRLFEEYLGILSETGLREFFEPVTQRVTLSTHAGVRKPAEKIFEIALERLGVQAPLSDCLLITENGEHIAAARDRLHMKTLRFRKPGDPVFDFEDWAQAPALIVSMISPQQQANVETIARAELAARGVEVTAVEPGADDAVQISGRVWHPVTLPEVAGDEAVLVAVPVSGRVAIRSGGTLDSTGLEVSNEAIEEVVNQARSLAAHHKIEGQKGLKFGRPTHAIQRDESGVPKLVRKGFD